MSEASWALYHGYDLRTQGEPQPKAGAPRGWLVMVTDSSGQPVPDSAKGGPWMSQTEAEKRAEKITRTTSKQTEFPNRAMTICLNGSQDRTFSALPNLEPRGWSRTIRKRVLRTHAFPLGYRATILIVRLGKSFRGGLFFPA
jgi:hypothetical protein